MIDTTSPEFVAGRVVAVIALEKLILARTALFVWGAAVIAAVLVIGAVASDGFGAVVVGLFALVAVSVAVTLFAVRHVVLRGVRRVGGGRDYARLRPLVERRVRETAQARSVVALDTPGALRLVWMARRPAALRDHVRKTAETVVLTIPEVVADVRRELSR